MIDWLDNLPLPSDWTTKTIGDAYVFTRKPRSVQVADFATVPFVPMDLVPVQGASRISWIDKKPAEITSGTYFEKGDVLLSRITPSFENSKQGMADELPAPFGYGSTELIPIQAKPGESDAHFLFYLLLHPTLRAQIASKMEGSTGRQRVSESLVRDWPIPFPPFDEQRKIAAVLGKVQAAVAVEGDLVRVARELKQAALRQLFTHGLRHEPQKQSPLGPVPESWEVVPFSKFVTLQRGADLIKGDFREGTVPVIGATRIIGYHDIANVRGPGVTVVRSGSSAGKAMFISTDFWAHNVVLYVKDFQGNDPLFTSHWINLVDLTRFRAGVAVPTLNRNSFENEPVPLPPPAEQREIAALLATLDAKIAHHEARQALLRELFRTLLHDLLTARRRVTSLDLPDDFSASNLTSPSGSPALG